MKVKNIKTWDYECTDCFADFEFNSMDIKEDQNSIFGSKYVLCPVCNTRCYVTFILGFKKS